MKLRSRTIEKKSDSINKLSQNSSEKLKKLPEKSTRQSLKKTPEKPNKKTILEENPIKITRKEIDLNKTQNLIDDELETSGFQGCKTLDLLEESLNLNLSFLTPQCTLSRVSNLCSSTPIKLTNKMKKPKF